jgi:hypothetical protein
MVRLAAVIAGTVQGFIIKELPYHLQVFFSLHGCYRQKEPDSRLKEVKSTSNEIEHEKMDARL